MATAERITITPPPPPPPPPPFTEIVMRLTVEEANALATFLWNATWPGWLPSPDASKTHYCHVLSGISTALRDDAHVEHTLWSSMKRWLTADERTAIAAAVRRLEKERLDIGFNYMELLRVLAGREPK